MRDERRPMARAMAIIVVGMATVLCQAAPNTQQSRDMVRASTASATLSARQQAIVPIGAFAAAGDIAKLNTALNQGLDAGLTVSDTKEILVQLYAYAGFPRSLNALGELMKVLEARKQRGIQDAPVIRPAAPFRRVTRCWPRARPTRPSWRARRSRDRCSTSLPPSMTTSRRISSGHLRARQPRLAKPRAGHCEHAVCTAWRRVSTAVPHGHQLEHGPHG